MDDLPAGDFRRAAPPSGFELLRPEAYQSACKHRSVRGRDIHGVARGKFATQARNTHRKQTPLPLHHGEARPVVDRQCSVGRLAERDPQLASRQPDVPWIEVRAEVLARRYPLDNVRFRCTSHNYPYTGETRYPRGRNLRRHSTGSKIRAAPSGDALQLGRYLLDLLDEWSVRIHSWIGGVQAVGIGQQQQQLGHSQMCNEGREAIILTEADFVDSDRV